MIRHPLHGGVETAAALTLALLVDCTPDTAQRQVTFEHHFGGDGVDRGVAVQPLANGDVAVVGYSTSFGQGDEDVYLIRIDSVGNVIWERTYGGDGSDNGWDVLTPIDGGFFIVGYTNSTTAGDFDVYMLRTDSEGELLWERQYGTGGDEYGWSAVLLPDGGVAVAGETGPRGVYGEGDRDFYLLRTDSLGQLLWERSFREPGTDRSYSIGLAPDGGFLLYGSTTSKGAGGVDAYLIKTDSTGIVMWEKTYGTEEFDMGHDVHVCRDGKLLLTGYTESFGSAGRDGWLMQTDTRGTVVWQQTLGGSGEDRLLRGIDTDDGGYAAAGFATDPESPGSDFFLVRASSDGKALWHHTFGGPHNEIGYGLAGSRGGGIVVTGWADSGNPSDVDLVLIKTRDFDRQAYTH